jgi:hypothetical protein
LLDIGEELLRSCEPENLSQVARDVLPSRKIWQEALGPFLDLPPRSSTAITSPLSGVVHLVNCDVPESLSKRFEDIKRDSNQCSSAFRLTHFTVRMMSLFDFNELLDQESLEVLFSNLPLAVQLVEDDLDIERYNHIAEPLTHELREEYRDIVNEARKIICSWRSSNQHVHSTEVTIASALASVWKAKLEGLDDTSPAAYRVGEAFAKLMNDMDPSAMDYSSEAVGHLCKELRTGNAIRSASWVAVLRRSMLSNPAGIRVCNEFVADSTGLKVEDESANG